MAAPGKPSREPRVYLADAPALAMPACGEAWIAGYATEAAGRESIIYYRTAGLERPSVRAVTCRESGGAIECGIGVTRRHSRP